MVSKMNLPIKPHPKPYKLRWLDEEEAIKVTHQVEVPVTIGRYEEVILCDVVPMEVCHVLLGWPWYLDRIAVHNKNKNQISFIHQGKKLLLKPNSPQEVNEDQVRLREKLLREMREKEAEIVREKLLREKQESEAEREEIEKQKEKEKEENERRKVERKRESEIEKGEEKKSKKILNPNNLFSLDFDSSQGHADESVNEAPKLPNLKKKCVGIILHAPLLIQPNFGSQPCEDNKNKHMTHSHDEVELCLFEKSNLQFPWKRSNEINHGVGFWESTRMPSLKQETNTIGLAFLKVVFDPGGVAVHDNLTLSKRNKALRFGTNLL